MSRIAFITLYDEYCYGTRLMAASLFAHGHEAHILQLKSFVLPVIPHGDAERRKIVEESDSTVITAIFPDGDRFIPFPSPVTENETRLLLDKLQEIDPDFIGFSLLSMHTPTAERMTRRVKEAFPNVPIIWGGIHVIMCPEESIRRADIICTGEGEKAIVELLDNPERTDVRGFWFKDGKGNVIKNEFLPLNSELDDLPFATYKTNEWQIDEDRISDIMMTHELFIRDHYRIGTARNCPYKCRYCHHSMFRDIYKGQKYLRRRSVDSVIDELKQRKAELGLTFINFIDDVFMMDKRWVAEFAPKYKAEIGLPFYGAAHPKSTTREILEMCKAAGCTHTGFGLQSGSSKMVNDVFGRGTTNEQNVTLVKNMVEVGFEDICLDVLTNSKYEDEEDCMETLRFLCAVPKPFSLHLYKLMEFPTSKLKYMEGLPEGTQTPEGFFHYNMLYLMTQNNRLPSEAILRMAKDEYLRSHPTILADLCSALITPDKQIQDLQNRIKILSFELENRTLRRVAKERLKQILPTPIQNVLRPVKKALLR